MHLINLLLLSCFIVFVIDLSGFVDEIVSRLYNKYVGAGDYHHILPKLKPFSCSLCMTFWVGLIYLLITHSFTIPYIAFVCLLAFLTPVTGDFLTLIKDTLTKIITKLYELLHL